MICSMLVWIFTFEYQRGGGGGNVGLGRKQISGLSADVVTLAEDREMLNTPNPNLLPLNKPLSQFWFPSQCPIPKSCHRLLVQMLTLKTTVINFENKFWIQFLHYHKRTSVKGDYHADQKNENYYNAKIWLFCWWDFETGRPTETSNLNSEQDK